MPKMYKSVLCAKHTILIVNRAVKHLPLFFIMYATVQALLKAREKIFIEPSISSCTMVSSILSRQRVQ